MTSKIFLFLSSFQWRWRSSKNLKVLILNIFIISSLILVIIYGWLFCYSYFMYLHLSDTSLCSSGFCQWRSLPFIHWIQMVFNLQELIAYTYWTDVGSPGVWQTHFFVIPHHQISAYLKDSYNFWDFLEFEDYNFSVMMNYFSFWGFHWLTDINSNVPSLLLRKSRTQLNVRLKR